jgi:predicted aspartyl protease
MISGSVNDRREAMLRVLIQNQAGQMVGIDAVVDTGFNGSLTLPSVTIKSLGLPWRGKTEVVLANGMIDQCDIHAATVQWDGIARHVL